MELFNDFVDPSGPLSVPHPRRATSSPGVTWIGLLYFFNFVQVPAYAELSDGARSEALRKLTFRALWWFRYAAAAHLPLRDHARRHPGRRREHGQLPRRASSGTAILTGMLFGITMFLNVWGVIWRNQKIVIGNAENVASGGEANPDAPAAAKKAARASRCNTLFSITMLWFMVFAAHGGELLRRPDRQHGRLLGARARALGLHRGVGPRLHRRHRQRRSTRRPSTSTRTRSSVGFVLLAVDLLRRLGAPAPGLSRRSADDEVGLHAGRLVAGDVAVQLVVAGRQLDGAGVGVADRSA